MESPRRDHGDNATQAGRRRLFCEVCGYEDFENGDDGFFYCLQCGSQSQSVVATEVDADDVFGGEGGAGSLYSLFHHRSKVHSIPSYLNKNTKLPSMEEILKSFVQPDDTFKKNSVAMHYGFDDESSSPQDFEPLGCDNLSEEMGGLRLRYVQGLQLMLQFQCEALMEKHGVSPLICGMAMEVWLRYVAVSRVFEDGWVEEMVDEAKIVVEAKFIQKSKNVDSEMLIDRKERLVTRKKVQFKIKVEHSKPFRQKVISISFRSLRKLIPIYSTLAISFLSCHLARESVLPTDIFKWASESKLPYISAFIELENHLGTPKICSLSTRTMFRPIRIISASLLEATAASIAQKVGLRTPSVNFYAIARRYLKELSLPSSKILPQACRIYEWSLPSELWLSSNHSAFPTRVYVMSILIVTIRILYNIQGQGVWESSLLNVSDFNSFALKYQGSSRKNDATQASDSNDSSSSQKSELCTKELLQILDVGYQRMSSIDEHSKDLRSYLKYCRDVVFSGLSPSYEEGKLIERLWDLYDNKEIDDEETKFVELKIKRPKLEEESINLSAVFEEAVKEENENIKQKKESTSSIYSVASRKAAIERMKFEMEDDGFEYLPPRVSRTDNYLHYRRQKADGNLIYVAHADYFILLRACAMLAQVDSRVLHFAVLKFEKRLDWIEQRIHQSLKLL